MLVLFALGCASNVFVRQSMDCEGAGAVVVLDANVDVYWNVFGGGFGREPFLVDDELEREGACYVDAGGEGREPWLDEEPWTSSALTESWVYGEDDPVYVAEATDVYVEGPQELRMGFFFDDDPGPVSLRTDFVRIYGAGGTGRGWLTLSAGGLEIDCPTCIVDLDLSGREAFYLETDVDALTLCSDDEAPLVSQLPLREDLDLGAGRIQWWQRGSGGWWYTVSEDGTPIRRIDAGDRIRPEWCP